MSNFEINRNDTLFFCIDMQDRLTKAMFNRDLLFKNSKILFELSKIYDIPLLLTEQNPKGLGNTSNELLDLIKDKKNINIFPKMDFNALTESVFESILNLEKENPNFKDKKNIVIFGAETHICVFQTARSLSKIGYNIFLVSDAVGSRSEKNYENGIQLIDKLGENTVITNTETIVFDIIKTSSDNHFKEAQKLII